MHVIEDVPLPPTTVLQYTKASRLGDTSSVERDAVTLSAVTSTCSCGAASKMLGRKIISDSGQGGGGSGGGVGTVDPDAPCCVNCQSSSSNHQQPTTENWYEIFRFFLRARITSFLLFPNSSIVNQIGDLTVRIDHLEMNLKKDIGTILDILHQQQQLQFQQFQHQQAAAAGKQLANLYQPSESDFSFDLAAANAMLDTGPVCGVGGGVGDGRQESVGVGLSSVRGASVQRSISQPETCTNEVDKSLLK